MSFTSVLGGNATLATDINQYANVLNGTTAGGLVVSGGNNATIPAALSYTGFNSADATVLTAKIAGDSNSRVKLYMRTADGYGAIGAGAGTSNTATLRAGASGWTIDQSLVVTSALTVNGGATLSSLVNTGTLSSDAGKVLSDGAGHMTLNGDKVPTSVNALKIWVQVADPGGSASEGDLWFKV